MAVQIQSGISISGTGTLGEIAAFVEAARSYGFDDDADVEGYVNLTAYGDPTPVGGDKPSAIVVLTQETPDALRAQAVEALS